MGIAVAGDHRASIERYAALPGIDFDIIVIFSVAITGREKRFWQQGQVNILTKILTGKDRRIIRKGNTRSGCQPVIPFVPDCTLAASGIEMFSFIITTPLGKIKKQRCVFNFCHQFSIS